MNYIKITVREKRAKCNGRERIVCGNSDYVIKFDFDDEWAAYDTKTARFVYDGGKYTDVQFTGDEVGVPVLRDTRTVSVGCYAGDIRTTTAALIQAVPCCTDPDGTPADPAPDVYNQLMERFDKMEAPEAVLYTEQELTDEQKAAARANIGAMNAERFVVTITADDSGDFSADKTFAQIKQAYETGSVIAAEVVPFDDRVFAMRCINDNEVLFDAFGYGAVGEIVIGKNDKVEYAAALVPLPSGDDPLPAGTATPGESDDYARADHVHPTDTFVVKWNRTGPTSYSPDKTFAEVTAAAEAGKRLEAVLDGLTYRCNETGTAQMSYRFNTYYTQHRVLWILYKSDGTFEFGTDQLAKPIAKTTDMTQDVGIDSEGKLYTKAGGETWEKIGEITLAVEGETFPVAFSITQEQVQQYSGFLVRQEGLHDGTYTSDLAMSIQAATITPYSWKWSNHAWGAGMYYWLLPNDIAPSRLNAYAFSWNSGGNGYYTARYMNPNTVDGTKPITITIKCTTESPKFKSGCGFKLYGRKR